MRNRDERRMRLSMSTSEETHWLEAELEKYKQDLQQDLTQIENKLHRTRERLRPATFIEEKIFLALSISFALGFVLGYWDVPIRDVGKPVARTLAATVGKQIAVHAIKG
jgi:hypothetical protein